jgi:hypothetical protein
VADEAEWLGVVEAALEGVAHTLNNRAASIQAYIGLQAAASGQRTAGGGAPPPDPDDGQLDRDAQRVIECSSVLQSIAERVDREEALSVATVLDDAIRLHHFVHARRGEVPVSVEATDRVSPVRATRWLLFRALAMTLVERTRDSAPGQPVRVKLESTDDVVRVIVSGAANGVAPIGRTYSEALITSLEGRVLRSDSDMVIELPSLRSRRASDRR